MTERMEFKDEDVRYIIDKKTTVRIEFMFWAFIIMWLVTILIFLLDRVNIMTKVIQYCG